MRLLILVPAFLFAASTGVDHWSASDLKALGTRIQPKATDKVRVASQSLGDWGTHNGLLVHRNGDGEAEVHDGWVDFMVVVDGEGTIVTGGTVRNPRATGPGEVRGSSIDGGERLALKPGDIVHIPARVPHQVMVSKDILYYTLKVKP